jgi:hypothetical protein
MRRQQKLGSLEETFDPNSLIVKGTQRYAYIPIDFIKCEVINFPKEQLLSNPILNFMSLVNEDTGEVKPKRFAYYKNIKIVVADSGYIEFLGSIHVYFNEGKHNYNDFTFERYNNALNRIYEDLGISPSNLYIKNLEYGVNIKPPIQTKRILDHCFIHKRLTISKVLNNKEGQYIQAEHKGNYILKIYDKAKQYKRINLGNIPLNEILRIEVKQIRWGKYRDLGIYTLEDFNNYDKSIFINDLLNKWNEVVFYDPERMNPNYMDKYMNLNFWISLLERNPKTYYRHLGILKEQNNDYGKNIQFQISEIIKEYIEEMNLRIN